MTPMEAWSIISKNLVQLYNIRKEYGCFGNPYQKICGYDGADIDAEVIAFQALREMEERKKERKKGRRTMNDREKLVEELAKLMIELKNALDEQYEISLNDCFFRELAHQMVANGVTYVPDNSKWIPVTERLPDLIPCSAGTAYSEAVNVLTSGRKVLTAIWDGTDFIADAEFWEANGEEITHWTPILLPLPTPPEGDRT